MVVRRGARLIGAAASAAALVGGFLTAGSPSANAEDPTPVVVQQRFTTADGVALQTTLASPGPVEARPTVVEFSPYGNNSQTFSFGPVYNYLLVQIRGTGSSRGSFDALGPRTQRDVVEVLGWACTQPVSDGRLALAGFSASAIMLFNSWHQELPCVEAAVTRSGTHELYRDLLVPGGVMNLLPDGSPVGTDGGAAEAVAWLDHHVRGVDNGVETHPRVQMLMSQGDRARYLAGDYVSRDATDWPVPGTEWVPLALTGDRSLSLTRPATARTHAYATVPTIPTMTDVPTAALVGAAGLDLLTGSLPVLTQDQLAGLTGLTYTTPALSAPVDLAGPLSFEVPLSTTTPDSGIWVVLSDVAPDGSSHPLTVGRLSTSYPDVIESRSLVDSTGTVVQPYGDYTTEKPAKSLQWRNYQVELWPVGNRFRAGHRIRLSIVGTSAASMPALPALHSIRVGGPAGARLLVPVLPGSDLPAALGG